MTNKIVVSLLCLCIVLAVCLGMVTHRLVEAREQNARMEKQLKEITRQVDDIWIEYMSIMKRIQHNSQRGE
jgi:uncharacterized protein YoxC